MQKNFLRILHLGESNFWDIVQQAGQPSDTQKQAWQDSLRQLPIHLWCGDAHDTEAQAFLKVFNELNVEYVEHQCMGFDVLALHEEAEKHTQPCVHVACGFTHTQLEVLSNETGGAWLNGYGAKNAPWAALAEVVLMHSLIQEENRLQLDALRICWLGEVSALAQSLIEAAIYVPFELFMGIPSWSDPEQHETGFALKAGAKVFMTREPELALDDADLIYLDASLEQKAVEASKQGKGVSSISLGFESFSWKQGFCLTAQYMARAKDTVRILPTHMGAQVQDMDVQLQGKRQAIRQNVLLACMHHVVKNAMAQNQ